LSRGNEDDDGMVAANVPPVATCAGDALGTEAFASALAAAATGDSALVADETVAGISVACFFPYQSISAIRTTAITISPKIEPRIFIII
jgi:hypothetical protein